MYAAHYNLKGRPFQLSPDHRFFYPSRGHKKAMAYLTYGLNERDGFIVITGHVGAGKTTIVGHLLSQIDESKFVSANIVTTQLGSDDTLRMVARAFGLPAENRDKTSILMDIEDFLVARRNEGKHVVLVIDEVQNMPFEAIEELRMLSNFQMDNRPLVQCFLLGQPEFKEKLAHPKLEQIRQRVIATCHLEPLGPEETRGYIEHRLQRVGWTGDPSFSAGAFRLIHQATDGVPRRINSLCGRLLLYGSLENSHVIDERIVEEVARELAEEAGHRDTEGDASPAQSAERDAPSPQSRDQAAPAPAVRQDPVPRPVPPAQPAAAPSSQEGTPEFGRPHVTAQESLVELRRRVAELKGVA